MKAVEKNFTTGMSERRPSASRMPSGKDTTMPTVATTMVTRMPPHSEDGTLASPIIGMPPSST